MKKFLRWLLRLAHLTPMHSVFRFLTRQGYDLRSMSILEVFGCDGEHHTRVLASTGAELEIWEYSPRYEPILRSRFPQAKIKITDSYAEIQRTPRKYDLVVVDNSDVSPAHYEHADMFPAVLQVLKPRSVLIVNVLPTMAQAAPEHLQARKSFYQVQDPHHIAWEQMVEAYREKAAACGLTLQAHHLVRRWTFRDLKNWFDPSDRLFYYGVLCLEATPQQAAAARSDSTAAASSI